MKLKSALILLFLCLPFALKSQTTGPEKGHLVVVGGAMESEAIINEFIELAGGLDANIVVIPTAAGRKSYSQNAGLAKRLKDMGATNVTVLHTNDKEEANSTDFNTPLENATGVWFGGGRQWRLVDAYENTLTEEMIKAVIDRDGVIGGSSAGATIQGSFLARGDTKTNQIMMGDHQKGFGYIKNVAIDQHVLARNRQFDLYEIMAAHPELLGLGIDEDTAIVVTGNTFKVIGENYVLVYDGNFWSREGSKLKKLPSKESLFYMLRAGDTYDMLNRQVID
ncbi:MAG: cyanophycinase [Bacteroidota bacterium]